MNSHSGAPTTLGNAGTARSGWKSGMSLRIAGLLASASGIHVERDQKFESGFLQR
jgi:hypothetical protein